MFRQRRSTFTCRQARPQMTGVYSKCMFSWYECLPEILTFYKIKYKCSSHDYVVWAGFAKESICFLSQTRKLKKNDWAYSEPRFVSIYTIFLKRPHCLEHFT